MTNNSQKNVNNAVQKVVVNVNTSDYPKKKRPQKKRSPPDVPIEQEQPIIRPTTQQPLNPRRPSPYLPNVVQVHNNTHLPAPPYFQVPQTNQTISINNMRESFEEKLQDLYHTLTRNAQTQAELDEANSAVASARASHESELSSMMTSGFSSSAPSSPPSFPPYTNMYNNPLSQDDEQMSSPMPSLVQPSIKSEPSSSVHGTSVLHPVSVVRVSETESGSTVPPQNINVRGNSSVASNETPVSSHGISSVGSNGGIYVPQPHESVGDESRASSLLSEYRNSSRGSSRRSRIGQEIRRIANSSGVSAGTRESLESIVNRINGSGASN
jgi:hypothetical protein